MLYRMKHPEHGWKDAQAIEVPSMLRNGWERVKESPKPKAKPAPAKSATKAEQKAEANTIDNAPVENKPVSKPVKTAGDVIREGDQLREKKED